MAKEYRTTQGDMWDSIAKKTMGSEYFLSELIDANPQYREVVIFPANIRIIIPDVDTESIQPSPPWLEVEDEL